MNSRVCDEVSVPEHEVGGQEVLDQDIWSSFSCWPVSRSACSRETEPTEIPGHVRRDSLWEWARKTMEAAGKARSMPPACCRTRKADARRHEDQELRRPRAGEQSTSQLEREGKNVPSLHFLALVQPQWMAGSAPTVLDYSVFGLKCRWLSSGNTLAATPSIWASLTCSINSLPPAPMLGRLTASGKRQGPRGLHPSFSVSISAGRDTREASTARLDRCSPPE